MIKIITLKSKTNQPLCKIHLTQDIQTTTLKVKLALHKVKLHKQTYL